MKSRIGRFVRQAVAVAADDVALLWRVPRLWLAVLAVALVPAVYAWIYLSSVWDPNAKANELPVGIVNLDAGYEYQGQRHNVGAELVLALLRTAEFGFQSYSDAEAARQAVRQGRLAFAIIVPPDFSAAALPGRQAGDGRIQVVLSEGNNYAAAGLARRFAQELGHKANEALNERRWEQVLQSADGSGRTLQALRAALAQLRSGAREYQGAMARYSASTAELVQGMRQAMASLREAQQHLPAEAELRALRQGTQRLLQGQRELGLGLEQLHGGARRVHSGAQQLQEELGNLPFIGERLAEPTGQLADGASQLTLGLASALQAQTQLQRGAERVDEACTRLGAGVGEMAAGLRGLLDRLPGDEQLQALVRGGQMLTQSGQRLQAGIELLVHALPASVARPDGSARGLADSVEPALQVLAPVPNNGSAFAPNMIAMALWLGAVMAFYLFDPRVLSQAHAGAGRLAQTLGRYALPAALVLLQAALITLVLRQVLGVSVPDPASYALVVTVAALAFLAVVFALLRLFGELGKLFAVLLLTLQLAAGGGVMPIELTADFFQAVHDWLPFTWVVRALRASLFGAFGQAWGRAVLELAGIGLAALLLAALARRWQLVPSAQYGAGVRL
jgi:putative membrane protein